MNTTVIFLLQTKYLFFKTIFVYSFVNWNKEYLHIMRRYTFDFENRYLEKIVHIPKYLDRFNYFYLLYSRDGNLVFHGIYKIITTRWLRFFWCLPNANLHKKLTYNQNVLEREGWNRLHLTISSKRKLQSNGEIRFVPPAQVVLPGLLWPESDVYACFGK